MTHLAVLPEDDRSGRARSWRPDRVRRALLAVQGVVGLMAAVCGPGLIVTDGLGMSRAVLEPTPFRSFVIPGIVLGVIVGGSLLVSTYLVWRRHHAARRAAIASSLALLGWICVEAVLIHDGRPLQIAVAAAALAMLALALRWQQRWHAPAWAGRRTDSWFS
jgi:hypothetical protein